MSDKKKFATNPMKKKNGKNIRKKNENHEIGDDK